MKTFENYECEGQMNIYEFLDQDDSCNNCAFYRNGSCKYKTLRCFCVSKPMANRTEGWKSKIELPENPLWMDSEFIVYDSHKDIYHFNVKGQVKDWTFKINNDGPKVGSVVAWRYVQ